MCCYDHNKSNNLQFVSLEWLWNDSWKKTQQKDGRPFFGTAVSTVALEDRYTVNSERFTTVYLWKTSEYLNAQNIKITGRSLYSPSPDLTPNNLLLLADKRYNMEFTFYIDQKQGPYIKTTARRLEKMFLIIVFVVEKL